MFGVSLNASVSNCAVVMVRKVTAGSPLRATLTYICTADGGQSLGLS